MSVAKDGSTMEPSRILLKYIMRRMTEERHCYYEIWHQLFFKKLSNTYKESHTVQKEPDNLAHCPQIFVRQNLIKNKSMWWCSEDWNVENKVHLIPACRIFLAPSQFQEVKNIIFTGCWWQTFSTPTAPLNGDIYSYIINTSVIDEPHAFAW